MILFLIFIIIFLVIIYFLHKKYSEHYWFNLSKNISDSKYFNSEKFDNGSFTKINLDEINLNGLEKLYKDYFDSFEVSKKTIENFFRNMENPAIIFNKNIEYTGCVLNSINKVIYRGNLKLVNFVDYAIVKKEYRHKNLFQGLLNEISKYTNKYCKLVIFKIDINPIPSLKDYNFISEYYMGIKKDMGKESVIIVKKDIDNSYYDKINIFFKNNFKFFPVISENSNLGNILKNNDERITLIIDKKLIMNLKYNSKDYLELLYIIDLGDGEKLMEEGIKYINREIDFKYLMIDNIGMNYKLVKEMGEYFIKKHKTYHYILSMDEKLKKEEIYYYF